MPNQQSNHREPLVAIELNHDLSARLIDTGHSRALKAETETWTIHHPKTPLEPVMQVELFRPTGSNPDGLWFAWTGRFFRKTEKDLANRLSDRRNEAAKLMKG